jgi:alkylhydroperoxidase family enzyme
MAWIDLPGDEDTRELERVTRKWRQQRGVPHVVGVMKPSVPALRGVMAMNNAVTFGGSTLGRRREELIATTVSALNDCFY